jgi:hypothetical protein
MSRPIICLHVTAITPAASESPLTIEDDLGAALLVSLEPPPEFWGSVAMVTPDVLNQLALMKLPAAVTYAHAILLMLLAVVRSELGCRLRTPIVLGVPDACVAQMLRGRVAPTTPRMAALVAEARELLSQNLPNAKVRGMRFYDLVGGREFRDRWEISE